MVPVKWGIISTANIGLELVVPAMARSPSCDIVAIASRDRARAESAAARLGIPRAYDSYEALLADAEIEAVYNPLPNHLHVPVSIEAAEAGKHVLCEKPIALTAAGSNCRCSSRNNTYCETCTYLDRKTLGPEKQIPICFGGFCIFHFFCLRRLEAKGTDYSLAITASATTSSRRCRPQLRTW